MPERSTSEFAEPRDGATTLLRRDPGGIAQALEAWLPGVLDTASSVAVRNLEAPTGSGFSNETYRFELASEANGSTARFVLQAAPLGDALFQSYDIEKMFRVQRGLRAHGVPTPNVRWYEDDPAVLGAPFYVMDHVSGQVPADAPSWHAEGFVAEASPADRERLWWSGVETMARVHRVDPAVLDVDLGPPGDDAIARRLEFWDGFKRWSCADELPLYEEGRATCASDRPSLQEPSGRS